MTRRLAIALLALLPVTPVRAQESAPVTIDASPSAAETLRRAEESAAVNPGEAARLAQEVLERFGPRLVPWPPEADRFRSATAAAEDFLRTHPAVLERWLKQQAPVAERAVEQGEWIDTVRLRGATPAALRALCFLAQRAMDQGRPFEARAWVERALQHPALDPATRARLEAARQSLRPAEVARAAAAAPTATAEWQPLWSVPVRQAWMNRRIAELDVPAARKMLDASVTDGSALTAQPVFDGDAVLLGDGTEVQCLDRFGGGTLWRAAVGSERDRTSQPIGDLDVARAMDGLVVTLPGHALADQRSGPPRVVALDRADGRPRWDLNLTALRRAEFEDLFPHGDPVAVGDLVVVQARKSNSRLESAAWLLALERSSGRVRWALSLGAAGGVRLAASRPLGSPTALGDDLIAATSLGVVARVDAATGDIRWLRRWPAPNREPRTATPAWQLPSPVADQRLVAWLAPDTATLVGLDPADGRTLFQAPVGVDTPIGAARTLLLGTELLYAIGDDVVAVDRRDPTRIAWSLAKRLEAGERVRGQAALGTLADGSPALAIPTSLRLLLLSPDDGSIVGQAAVPGGGNLALERGQLAVAGAQSLSLVMQGSQGERLLRERLAADPSDPRRGLALVELGRSWRRAPLLLDGAVAALSALGGPDTPAGAQVRESLLRTLLDPQLLTAIDDADAARLLDLAGQLARTPPQRAELMLCRAQRQSAAGAQAAAQATLQALLADAAVRQAPVRMDAGRQVCAGMLALQRLATAGDASARERIRSMWAPMPQSVQPQVGTPGGPVHVFAGFIVPEAEGVQGLRPTHAVLLQEAQALAMRRGPSMEVAWRAHFVGSDSTVLAWAPSLVVWSAMGADRGRLIGLDPATGAVRWNVDDVTQLFGAPVEVPTGVDVVDRTDLRRVDAAVTDGRVVVWRGDGQVVALDASKGGEVIWRRAAGEIRQLEAAHPSSGQVVCAGFPEVGSDRVRVEVLGVDDGSPRLQGECPASVGKPQWVRAVPGGVAVGGSEGVAVLDLMPALPVRWIQQDPRTRMCDLMAVGGSSLLLCDAPQRRVGELSLLDGALRADFLRPGEAADANAFAGLHAVDGRWLGHRLLSLTLHDADGALVGEAAGAPSRRHDQVAMARDAVLSVELVQPDPVRPFDAVDDRGGVFVPRLAVRRYVVSQGLRQAGPPLVLRTEGLRPRALETVDGWVLIGCDDRTLAVAAPTRPDSPR